MNVAGGKLRSGAHPPVLDTSARRPDGAHESSPCQRGIHAPRLGRGQVLLTDRWVRLSRRSSLPTGYPH